MASLQGVKGLFQGAGDATAIIEVLSRVLTQLIDLNRKATSKQQLITKFQSSYPPTISILAYLERINKYAKCSPNCFIIALIYIDRLIETRNVILSNLNVHRVLITSLVVATKVHDDEFYKNAYYAKLGGVSTQEMNSLELEFLSLMNFDFFVTVETFEKYQKELSAFVSPVAPTAAAAPVLGVEEGAGIGGGLSLSTPSPAALVSCGQYRSQDPSAQQQPQHLLGSICQPSQTNCHTAGANSDVGESIGGLSEVSMSSVVVPLSYECDSVQSQFSTVTPPPLCAPQQQGCYLNQPHSQLSGDMQHMGNGGGGSVANLGAGKWLVGQPQGMYSGSAATAPGGGQYVTPVTTPTSVAEAVFSWGGGNGGGADCGVQGHVETRAINTQLFPPHYYPPQEQLQSQQQFAPPAPPMLSGGPFHAHQQQPLSQQPYYYPPQHAPQHLRHGQRPSFYTGHSHAMHPMHHQRFVVTAGGGFWSSAGP